MMTVGETNFCSDALLAMRSIGRMSMELLERRFFAVKLVTMKSLRTDSVR